MSALKSDQALRWARSNQQPTILTGVTEVRGGGSVTALCGRAKVQAFHSLVVTFHQLGA